jgi:hypothetical protein
MSTRLSRGDLLSSTLQLSSGGLGLGNERMRVLATAKSIYLSIALDRCFMQQ